MFILEVLVSKKEAEESARGRERLFRRAACRAVVSNERVFLQGRKKVSRNFSHIIIPEKRSIFKGNAQKLCANFSNMSNGKACIFWYNGFASTKHRIYHLRKGRTSNR